MTDEVVVTAKRLLRQAFEPDLEIPADLADLARRIDDRNA